MPDSVKKFLETQDRISQHLRLTSEIKRACDPLGDAYRRLVEEEERRRTLLRAVTGPFEEMRRSGALDPVSAWRQEIEHTSKRITELHNTHQLSTIAEAGRLARDIAGPLREMQRLGAFDLNSPWQQQIEHTRTLCAEYERRFRLPEINEITRFARELTEQNRISPALEALNLGEGPLLNAMEAMRSPWLDAQNPLHSVQSFAEIQAIGAALRASPPYETALANTLRAGLGDWREPLSWPEQIFTEPDARLAFYVERGFNPRLTDFPAPAIEEGQVLAGLRQPPPPVVPEYDGDAATEQDLDAQELDELGFARNRAAFDRLQRFETQVRRFIDTRMTAAFGAGWVKQRVPGDLLTEWRRKRDVAREKGEPERPLIAYADFTDYIRIIERSDNWDAVFEVVFRRKEDVRESFQRIFPVRICTAHARFITANDRLFLRVETYRILRAMDIT